MIDKITNKPFGFGRIVYCNGVFTDRLYKDGQENGFYRTIFPDGDHWIG